MDPCLQCEQHPCQCPKTLADWCRVNNLTTIESKLRSQEGIFEISELKEFSSDVEQIISTCQMNRGDALRFRKAMNALTDQPSQPSTPLAESQDSQPQTNQVPSGPSTSFSQVAPPSQLLVLNQFQYKLQKQLGKGGFGVVWKATDVNTNMVVAIKQQTPDANSPKNWFVDELKIHQLLNQPPTVPRVPKIITSAEIVCPPCPFLVFLF